MTDFLGVDDLLLIARSVVGPSCVVTDAGLLASAAARPEATVLGEDAYEGLAAKAAALLVSLVRNHALLDGNERLGWASAVVFCELNERDLRPPDDDAAYDLVMAIADGSSVHVPVIAQVLESWLAELPYA